MIKIWRVDLFGGPDGAMFEGSYYFTSNRAKDAFVKRFKGDPFHPTSAWQVTAYGSMDELDLEQAKKFIKG